VYHLWRIYGFYEITRLGMLAGRQGELSLRDTFGTEAAPSDQVGRYRVALEAADTLRFEVVADASAERATYFEPASPFRRVAGLDELVGTWSDRAGERIVVLGRDLTFEMYRADEELEMHRIEAGFCWPQDGQLYLLTGNTGSFRCEAFADGLYAFGLGGDGTLTLGAARDRCGYRREWLDGRELVRVEAVERLVGLWSDGQTALHVHRDASYDLLANSEERVRIVAQGRAWLTPDGLRMQDWAGEAACFSAQSAVALDAGATRLTTRLVAGECGAEGGLHVAARTWTRR
jgi:hypothetical protein